MSLAGEPFQIFILAWDDQFYIQLNGKPYCTYKYRLPLEENLYLYVLGYGRAAIENFRQIDHRRTLPYSWPWLQITDQNNEFSNEVPDRFQPGDVLVITGLPYGTPVGRFALRFMEGDTKRESLHFNVRFDQKAVVRNAMNPDLT